MSMMHFKVGQVSRWKLYPDDGILFEGDQPRKVRIEFMTNEHVDIYLVDEQGEATLVASHGGQFTVQFTSAGRTVLQVSHSGEAVVYYSGDENVAKAQRSEKKSFATVAPRRKRSSELDHILRQSRLNELRREQHYQRELERLERIEKRQALIEEENAQLRAERKERRKAEKEQERSESEPPEADDPKVQSQGRENDADE